MIKTVVGLRSAVHERMSSQIFIRPRSIQSDSRITAPPDSAKDDNMIVDAIAITQNSMRTKNRMLSLNGIIEERFMWL